MVSRGNDLSALVFDFFKLGDIRNHGGCPSVRHRCQGIPVTLGLGNTHSKMYSGGPSNPIAFPVGETATGIGENFVRFLHVTARRIQDRSTCGSFNPGKVCLVILRLGEIQLVIFQIMGCNKVLV